ncbi:MAG: PIN domain-containing protein [Paludibacteraceae bacterium]|nr:PIN domain-containing protein [Paludibacteraceae bacterium]
MENKYLLDTNIWIFLLHGDKNIAQMMISAGEGACCLSIITAYELMFGAYKSGRDTEILKVNTILDKYQIIPLGNPNLYAMQKLELTNKGMMIDELDFMIASTAIEKNLILVTDNTKHFSRFDNLILENWRKR